MFYESAAALLVGAAALAFVVSPLLRRNGRGASRAPDWIDPEETPKGIALAALKEIEFDRATGKLSDTDYQMLMSRYTGQAVEAMRAEEQTGEPAAADVESVIAAKVRAIRSGAGESAPSCPTCGPRPESDAIFCSHCGTRLPTGHACEGCGAALPPDGRFCESCGRKVAA